MNAPRVVGDLTDLAPAKTRLSRAALETMLSQSILFGVIAAAVFGWLRRDRLPTAEDGIGYALGIVGSLLMVLLMLYPLRKRLAPVHWSGSIGLWFRLHMLLGLLGPLIILYHARFTYSATNSGVALLAMLIVVASGLIGRFIYGHVHRGFSQRKIETRELLEELAQSRLLLDADGDAGHRLVQRLEQLERTALVNRLTLIGNASALFYISIRSRILYWQSLRTVHSEQVADASASQLSDRAIVLHQRAIKLHLAQYLRTIRALGGFVFYDRLFRAWHYLHLPLFLFLLATATLHIVAVHMY
jgi:hypothetical protein